MPLRRGRYVVSRGETEAGPLVAPLLLTSAGRHRVTLSRCTRGCDSIQIVRGLVVWADGAVIRGYALPSGRRLRWPARHALRYSPSVVATDWELYIYAWSADPLDDEDAISRLYVTRWRRALR